ncbi:S8 family peptidase [Rhizorhabdus argentea]|uniref:S8 family peptidase n=1 Tax=Rhizorhabdus argentea TaxID=1387174 RepID=UPI0030EEC225
MIRRLFRLLSPIATLVMLATPVVGHAAQGDQILVMLRIPPPHFRSGGSYDSGYGNSIGRNQLRRQAQRIARDHHLTLITDWMMPVIDLDCFVMLAPRGVSADVMAEEVSKDGHVAWSQPMHDYRTLGDQRQQGSGHDDPLYPAQPARMIWHLDALHRLATGRGIRVAVIDSGIDAHHPDLAGQIAANVNLVGDRALAAEAHGTAVAGIIAARADDRIGIAGIAPGARLLGLRACWQTGSSGGVAVCDSLSLAKALHYAIDHKAPIINLSLGGPSDRLLAMLLNAAMARGASVVAAYDTRRPDGGFPASWPGIIAVSGTVVPGRRGDIYVAPAADIPTTWPGGGWGLVDGTSYAAAHVSGLVALIKQARGHRQGRSMFVKSAGGVIDALATVQGKAAGCEAVCRAPMASASRD